MVYYGLPGWVDKKDTIKEDRFPDVISTPMADVLNDPYEVNKKE